MGMWRSRLWVKLLGTNGKHVHTGTPCPILVPEYKVSTKLKGSRTAWPQVKGILTCDQVFFFRGKRKEGRLKHLLHESSAAPYLRHLSSFVLSCQIVAETQAVFMQPRRLIEMYLFTFQASGECWVYTVVFSENITDFKDQFSTAVFANLPLSMPCGTHCS